MNAPAKYSGLQPACRHSFLRIHHRADGHHRENLGRATVVYQQGWMPLLFVVNATGWSYWGKMRYSAPLFLAGALTAESSDLLSEPGLMRLIHSIHRRYCDLRRYQRRLAL